METVVSPRSKPILKHRGRKKEILIMRRQGGIGDILNSRMMFEDIKKSYPDKGLVYAVPEEFIPLVSDHPFIDKVLDWEHISTMGWYIFADITNRCGEYEHRHMPNVDKHRSDIWAESAGIKLTNHNMHISFNDGEIEFAKGILEGITKPIVTIQPVSAHPSKDWPMDRWQEVVDIISKNYGFSIICFHNKELPIKNVIMMGGNVNLREWMAITSQCDHVITVATSMYCLANGLHKPTVAIFGCEDLDIYGRYFPEMVPVQRHRKNSDGWGDCPCWQAWKGCRKNDNKPVYPPPCLSSITVDEVMKGFDRCVKMSQK